MQQILCLIIKEFRQIFHSRAMIGILFMAPVLQTILMGFAITTDTKHVKLLIVDLDRSKTSESIIEKFNETDRFDVVGNSQDPGDIQTEIRKWKTQCGIIIPKDFQRDLFNGKTPQLLISVDGIDGNTAGVASSYALQIISSMDLNAKIRQTPLLTVQERMWYNENLDTAQFMVPGVVAVLVTMVSMMMSSMSLVKEKEMGTLEQLLVTPINKWQLLLGKIFPFLILTFFEIVLSMTIAKVIFSINIHGSYLLLGGFAFLYLFTSLGLGIFVSTFTNSQMQAMFFSWFILVFMLLMSGLFVPIENMPPFVANLTYLNPLRYLIIIMREIILKANTLAGLWKEAVMLVVYGISILTFSVLKFSKKVG